MKTEDDIRDRLEKLKRTIRDNKVFLKNEDNLTDFEAEEIEEDNYELNTRIKMLEWVLN